jgi:hypothetical protein
MQIDYICDLNAKIMKNKFKKISLCAILVSSGFCSTAQIQKDKVVVNTDYSKFHLGLGAGMDYGGLGFKAEYLPIKYLGIFGGVGYNLKDPGLNAGIHFRPFPMLNLNPLL